MSLETAHIGVIRQAFTAMGANLPKAVTKAVAERDKIVASAPIPIATREQVADAIAVCLIEDRDPLEDAHVLRLAASQAIGGEVGDTSYSVGQAAERRVIAAFMSTVDEILETLTEYAAHAGQQLSDAFTLIGDNDLADSELVLKLGPDAARAWAVAREAEQLLRKVDRAWTALANVTHFASTSVEPTLRLADLDLETYEKVGRKATPWEIVRAGGRIDLASATTIRERSTRIASARQLRQDAGPAAEAAREERRRVHGITVNA